MSDLSNSADDSTADTAGCFTVSSDDNGGGGGGRKMSSIRTRSMSSRDSGGSESSANSEDSDGRRRRATRTRSSFGGDGKADSFGDIDVTRGPSNRPCRPCEPKGHTAGTGSVGEPRTINKPGDADLAGPSGVHRSGSSVSIAGMPSGQLGIALPVQRRQAQQKRRQEGGTGITVLLINEDKEEGERFIIRPESKLAVSSLSPLQCISTTLLCLRTGLAACVRTKTNGKEVDYLEIFCCKLPRQRRYHLFRRIMVVEPMEEHKDYYTVDGTFELIKLYVRCFAILGDFVLDYNLTLADDGGLPSNVLVIEKLWHYDKDIQAYRPTYTTLKGDFYTNRVLQRLKDFYKCQTVKFISTAHTGMFANYNVLNDTNKTGLVSKSYAPTSGAAIASTSSTDLPPVTASRGPLKKRKEVLLSYVEEPQRSAQQPVKKKKRVTFADEQQSSQQQAQQQQQQPQPQRRRPPLTNPTLIVFRPNVVSNERELLCIITLEVHLSDRIIYN